MIKEVIVVEGRDDIRAVKAALDCEVIATGGIRISASLIVELTALQKRRGLILLTDPDYAGKRIRSLLSEKIKGVKHAYVRREKAVSGEDIGVENASPEEIRRAISLAKPEHIARDVEYSNADLMAYGLVGRSDSKTRRIYLCEELGIGYQNGKQLLSKLSGYGIGREEFYLALDRMLERMGEEHDG